MEIIAEEEPSARGPYAGAVGYLTFAGDLDFCITIRTAVVTGGMAHVQSGAGIVSDSDPDRELAEVLAARRPEAVILSPGPGRPEDAGCMIELVGALDPATPLLGVCLGHQALGAAFGAPVVRAPHPVHGMTSAIHHDGDGIFAGLPSPFEAGRYHSLVVDAAGVPGDLEVTARTVDGLVMSLAHRRLPRFGVQFHPESILTPEGPRIVENFLEMSRRN